MNTITLKGSQLHILLITSCGHGMYAVSYCTVLAQICGVELYSKCGATLTNFMLLFLQTCFPRGH